MRVEVVLCEQAVRSSVREGKNRLAAGSGFRFAERLSDELERFVPRHAFESAFAFPSFSNRRVEQSIGQAVSTTAVGPPDAESRARLDVEFAGVAIFSEVLCLSTWVQCS